MKKSTLFIVATLFVLVFTACSKDEFNDTDAQTKIEQTTPNHIELAIDKDQLDVPPVK